jgi:periplasmic protein TonB
VHALPDTKPRRGLEATIYVSLAVSLALHLALALPFVLRHSRPPAQTVEALVIEVDGVVADTQTEEQVLRQTKGDVSAEETDQTKPDEPPPPPEVTPPEPRPVDAQTEPPPAQPEETPPAAVVMDAVPPEPDTKAAGTSATDAAGAEEEQIARKISSQREVELNRLRDYAKQLSKKIQANLVYPEDARQADLRGAVTVSFTVLAGGQIEPRSLRITVSSGQPKLDASALKTVHLSVPFNPPPEEMTVGIEVEFGRKP